MPVRVRLRADHPPLTPPDFELRALGHLCSQNEHAARRADLQTHTCSPYSRVEIERRCSDTVWE
jgi:hypothetical protein